MRGCNSGVNTAIFATPYPLVFDERCEPHDTEPAMAINDAQRTHAAAAAAVRQMRSDGTGSAPLRSDASNEDRLESHGACPSLRFALSWIVHWRRRFIRHETDRMDLPQRRVGRFRRACTSLPLRLVVYVIFQRPLKSLRAPVPLPRLRCALPRPFASASLGFLCGCHSSLRPIASSLPSHAFHRRISPSIFQSSPTR